MQVHIPFDSSMVFPPYTRTTTNGGSQEMRSYYAWIMSALHLGDADDNDADDAERCLAPIILSWAPIWVLTPWNGLKSHISPCTN